MVDVYNNRLFFFNWLDHYMVHICFFGVIKMGRTPLYCLNLSRTLPPSKQHTDKHIHSHTGFNNGWLTCRAVCRYKPLSRRLNIKFSQVSLTCQVSFVTRSTWCCHTRPAIPFLHSQVGFVTCKVNSLSSFLRRLLIIIILQR